MTGKRMTLSGSELNQEVMSIKEWRREGSCAINVVVTDEDIICANIGDSRAVLSRRHRAIPLSMDHKPNRPDERKRIEATGAKVGCCL